MRAANQKLGQILRQNVAQTQGMTPQLVQAIKLLQMPYADIINYVRDEFEKNPFLEYEESTDTLIYSESNSSSLDFDEGEVESPDSLMPTYSPAEITFPDNDSHYLQKNNIIQKGSNVELGLDFQISLPSTTSIQHKLVSQIALMTKDLRMRLICQYLITQLDETGYLQIDYDYFCIQYSIRADELSQAINMLQSCEPTGIAARDLKECLGLQLKDHGLYNAKMGILLDNLELVACNDQVSLMNLCDVDILSLQQMLKQIMALNPKPGELYSDPEPQSIIPDVIVYAVSPSKFRVELNSDLLPKLLINKTYYTIVNKDADCKEKKIFGTYIRSALDLIRALNQRAQSTLQVAEEIVRFQHTFLMSGLTYLKPMTLKDIASTINMHESTVSRVVANKYISTPQGIFEMKYFFSSAIASIKQNIFYSSRTVRYKIYQIIENENSNAILSDEDIARFLRNSDIDIARRTVAKYREEMNIPSSSQRRRQKLKILV